MSNVVVAVGVSLGIVAFVLLIAFEIIKCSAAVKGVKSNNPLFIIGCLFLVGGWAAVAAGCSISGTVAFIIGTVVLAAGVVLYIIVLLKTSGHDNYIKNEGHSDVMDSGIYGRIRHPGLWCFVVVAIGMGMMFPGSVIADILFTLMNVAYIVLQDMVFFPMYLDGYDEYKKRVPFCIPGIRRKQ